MLHGSRSSEVKHAIHSFISYGNYEQMQFYFGDVDCLFISCYCSLLDGLKKSRLFLYKSCAIFGLESLIFVNVWNWLDLLFNLVLVVEFI